MSAAEPPVDARLGGVPAAPSPAFRRLLPSLVASFVLPLIAYALTRPYVESDAEALAVGALFPATWTAVRLARSRRIDPLAAISLIGLCTALVFTLLSGGNPLLLKIQEAPLTGALGLAMLVSVVVRRPLLPILVSAIGYRLPVSSARAVTMTTIVGAILVVEALVRLGLALALSTTTFLEIHRPVTWAIWGVGILLLLATRGRTKQVRP